MAQALHSVTSDVEQLSERVRELERRVSALEGQPEKPVPTAAAEPNLALQRPRPPATWRGFPPAEIPGGAVPVLGKAVLGIAGAYLLRAIAESGAIPKLPILILAIVYAGLWMVWAVRTHAPNDLAPPPAALRAVALATEVAACLEHRLSMRAVPAIAADFAVWLIVDVMTSSQGVPEGYHPTAPSTITLLCLILFAIYGGS